MILVFSIYPGLMHLPVQMSSIGLNQNSGAQFLSWFDSNSRSGPGPPADLNNVSTRAEILGFINSNPGTYLRSISEEMGLALGDVQYHLGILTKEGEIVDRRDGRYRHFFESGKYDEIEQKVLSALRRDTAGRILTKLAGGQTSSHMELAATFDITSQAVSWQMGRLRSMGLIEVVSRGIGKSYRLRDGVTEIVGRHLHADKPFTLQELERRKTTRM